MTEMTLEEKVYALPKAKRDPLIDEYNRVELRNGSGRVLWFFGLHYLHVGKVGLWFLYVISCFFYVGIIRWIIQAVQLKSTIAEKNKEILEKIYNKYR